MWDSLLAPTAEQQAPSLYSILEVSILATPLEIKRQFRRLALQHHPDKAGNAAQFQAIRDAFEVLKDPTRRFAYDKTLLHQLDMQEYLHRFSELVLTVQGLSLPCYRLHQPASPAAQLTQQQQPQRPRCHWQPQQARQQTHRPPRPALLTRA